MSFIKFSPNEHILVMGTWSLKKRQKNTSNPQSILFLLSLVIAYIILYSTGSFICVNALYKWNYMELYSMSSHVCLLYFNITTSVFSIPLIQVHFNRCVFFLFCILLNIFQTQVMLILQSPK